MIRQWRYYVDTSVFGGCVDEEFQVESLALFDRVRQGRLLLLISPILLQELSQAPKQVQSILDRMPATSMEAVAFSHEAEALRHEYLLARVISPKWGDDAHHVALATVAKADLIVSWNFRHLVNVDRIRGFNAVNLRLGYQTIDIRSPKEVMSYEDERI